MELVTKRKSPWYIGGLHFQCVQCGRCCSGPGEGYIWVTRPEIRFIADYLKIPVGELRSRYLRRIGMRLSIIEDKNSRDCIFLEIVKMADARIGDEKKCRIYPVRPNQCRTWPFWSSNLISSNSWNEAARRCEGINRGRLYSFEQIEKIRTGKKWWENDGRTD